MQIFKVYHLQCARRLPALPASHPCARVHGHSFRIELTLRGALDPTLCWVRDFADIDAAWQALHATLDHRYLNDIDGLDNPTSERIAQYLWSRLQPALPELFTVAVMESHDAGCVYHGPGDD